MQQIRRIVRIVIGLFRRIKQFLCWEIQYWQVLKREKKCELQSIQSLGIKKVLILSPHADDELIGCSSFLLNKNIIVSVLYFRLYGYNNSEDNKKERDSEITRLSTNLGYKLYKTEDNVIDWLKEKLINHEYDTVLIPCPYDWHWEHRHVFTLFAEALNSVNSNNIPNLLFYNISVPTPSGHNTYVSCMGEKGQKEKWALFKEFYSSQKMPVYRYKLQEKLNYRGIASELFWRISKEEIEIINDQLNEAHFVSELNALKEYINNIKVVRNRAVSLMSVVI